MRRTSIVVADPGPIFGPASGICSGARATSRSSRPPRSRSLAGARGAAAGHRADRLRAPALGRRRGRLRPRAALRDAHDRLGLRPDRLRDPRSSPRRCERLPAQGDRAAGAPAGAPGRLHRRSAARPRSRRAPDRRSTLATTSRQTGRASAPSCLSRSRARGARTRPAGGARNRQIAESLGISEFTVKRHMQNILAKLGVRTRGPRRASFYRPGFVQRSGTPST